jgi:hypothetical protein
MAGHRRQSMSNVITLRVPESLYQRVKKLAKDDGISLNQYVQMALTEKLAREETMQMVEGRFNKLEEGVKLLYMEKEFEFDKRFEKQLHVVNGRYSLIEKRLRQARL